MILSNEKFPWKFKSQTERHGTHKNLTPYVCEDNRLRFLLILLLLYRKIFTSLDPLID